MQFTIALLLGLAVGSVLLLMSRRTPSADWPSRTLLGLGIAALVLFVVGILGFIDVPFAAIPALALPFTGLVFGVGRVLQGDRDRLSLLGLALAAVPGLFWIVFAISELLFPHP